MRTFLLTDRLVTTRFPECESKKSMTALSEMCNVLNERLAAKQSEV
jgi:hypothetical protein